MERSTHTDGSGDGQMPKPPPGGLVSDSSSPLPSGQLSDQAWREKYGGAAAAAFVADFQSLYSLPPTRTDGSGDGQMPKPPPGGLVSDLLPDMLPSESANARGAPTDAGAAEACAQVQLEAVMGGGINSGPPAVAHVSPETSAMNVARLAALDGGSPAATSAVPTPIPTRSALSFERFCQINNCEVKFRSRQSDSAPWVGNLVWRNSSMEDADITADNPRGVIDLVVAYLLKIDFTKPSGRTGGRGQDQILEAEWRLLRLTAPLLVPGFIDEPREATVEEIALRTI